MYDEVNGSVVIIAGLTARIITQDENSIEVAGSADENLYRVTQNDDTILMDRDEAEALFLVLDTMLHPHAE